MSNIKRYLEELENQDSDYKISVDEALHYLSQELREIAQSLEFIADRYESFRKIDYSTMFEKYFLQLEEALSSRGDVSHLVRPLSQLRESLSVIVIDAEELINTSEPSARSVRVFGLVPNVHRAIELSHIITRRIIKLHSVEAGLVPTQTPAPIRVKVEANRLAISNVKTNTGTITNEALDRVRRTAAEMVSAALSSINDAGNVDRRVSPAFEPLLRYLRASEANVSPEALGLNWKLARKLLNQFRDELPTIAILQLEEALSSVNVVINQYDEWRAYQAEQIASEISSADTQILVAEAEELAGELVSAGANVVDAEISMRLRDILAPTQYNLVRSETIVAPLVGSLANIFAGASEAALMILSKISTIPQGPAYALLIISLSILDKGGRLSAIPPFSFVKNAHDYIVKHHPYLKDIIRI